MSAPPAETMKISHVNQGLHALVNRVHHRETRVLIEKRGIPVAAIVSARDLQRLEQLDRKWAEGERVLREFAAGFADQTPEDIEREVAKAIAEVRAEKWAEQEQLYRREDVIRAALDTNVLAAGLVGLELRTSAPGIILARWLAGAGAGPFELVVSPHILAKLERTLTKPYFRTRRLQAQIEAAERFITSVATIVVPTIDVSGVAPHAEDDLVLAAAVTVEADYLVTGDKRFLAVGSYAGVTILSPRAFLDVLDMAEDP